MKRWMTFGLCIALLGTLAACGNAAENTVIKYLLSTGSVVELCLKGRRAGSRSTAHPMRSTDWQKGNWI